MESTEIMIGNHIYLTDNTGNRKEIIVNNHTFSDFEIKLGQTYSGIPLTREMLIDFGCDVLAGVDYDYYYLDRFRLFWKKEYKYWYVQEKESMTYITKIEFVHELQNLLFILNGQKLYKN